MLIQFVQINHGNTSIAYVYKLVKSNTANTAWREDLKGCTLYKSKPLECQTKRDYVREGTIYRGLEGLQVSLRGFYIAAFFFFFFYLLFCVDTDFLFINLQIVL